MHERGGVPQLDKYRNFFVRKSVNLLPQNYIQKLTFAELCVQNFANFHS